MIRATVLTQAQRLRDGRLKLMTDAAFWGLGQVGWALLMLLLTRAAPLSGGVPFAVACFTAALFLDHSPAALLIGCALGSPFELGSWAALMPLTGCMLALALHTLILRAKWLRYQQSARDVCCAAVAGASTFLAMLPFLRDMPFDLMMAGVNGALALASAPTLMSGLCLSIRRKRLLSEERVSLVLLWIALLIGIRSLPGVGQTAAHLLAALCTLIMANVSIGAGAVCGVLTGATLTLLGDTPYVGVALALCGVSAGAVRPLGKPAMALTFALGNAVSLVFTAGEQLGVINPYIALAAGAALCFVPHQAERQLSLWFEKQTLNCDVEVLSSHIRQDVHRQMRALGLLFDEMSKGYEAQEPMPDEQALVMRMRAKLCDGCTAYEHCWAGSHSRAGRLLVELLSDALCGRLMDAGAVELPPDIHRKCRRANQIPKRLGPMLSEFDQQRRAAKERGECKALLRSQFRMAAEVMLSEEDRLARPLRLDRELIDRAFGALEREGLEAQGVWALEDALPRLSVSLGARPWSRSAISMATRALSKTVGTEMKQLSADDAPLGAELCFVPSARMGVDVGFAGRAGQGGTTSGDSRLTRTLSDGRVLLALSDGMGSGGRAQSESTQALRLLWRFLDAGVPCSMALTAVNQLLLLRSEDEMFSTVDLCLLDLSGCRADFCKLGGCTSLILRRERFLRVEGGQLPMGILHKATPVETSLRLQQGDLIVMVTDGVLDASREGELEWLESTVLRHQNEPPQKLCERLVSMAAARSAKKKDDMTALVTRIETAQ